MKYKLTKQDQFNSGVLVDIEVEADKYKIIRNVVYFINNDKIEKIYDIFADPHCKLEKLTDNGWTDKYKHRH